MHYTYFRIQNFRGIRELRLDLRKSPRAYIYPLIGLNESGKTTILEAINFFSYGAEQVEAVQPGPSPLRTDIHDLIPITQRSNFNGLISIEAGLELDDDDVADLTQHLQSRARFRMTDVTREFTITEGYAFTNSKYVEENDTKVWTAKVEGKKPKQRIAKWYGFEDNDVRPAFKQFLLRRLPPILYFPNFLFNFPESIYLEDVRTGAAKNRDRFYREVLQDILDSLDLGGATISDHVVARAKSDDLNDRRSLEGLLLEMSRDVTKRVFTAWNEIFGRRVTDKEVELRIDSDSDGDWFIQFRIKDSDGFFSIGERSLGFRWFFGYLLLTAYRAHRAKSPRTLLFLFDEPASNLHSTAQAQLLQSFDRLVNPSVLIYSTHSHHLINVDWLESSYVVRNAGLSTDDEITEQHAGKTDIRVSRYREFAAKNPHLSSYYQPVLDVLDYRPSNLEAIPEVVMVEGKNDFFLLSYLLRTEFPNNSIRLLPGGGAGSLDDLIRLYYAWGRNFIILLDSDAEGEKQKARYSLMFGPLVEGRLYLLADCDPVWKGKALDQGFEAGERLMIQQLTYPSDSKFNKTHLSRAFQEAYLTRKVVPLSSPTLQRFQQTLSYLETALEKAASLD